MWELICWERKSLFSVQSIFICGFKAASHQTHLDEVLEGKENFKKKKREKMLSLKKGRGRKKEEGSGWVSRQKSVV